MTKADELKKHLLEQLPATHARYAELMEERLAAAGVDEIERYFGLISAFVAKLEDEERSLRDVIREMAAEYAVLILSELSGS